ncbi:bifunctional 5,10-methylenetetrahydrofolate dehydrogenase/5,10-methenyltetrahydrofolate cyclohydrolase [Marinivivus vitaminiproducens]|uniref:bifunctional 5,10-methylenetetrahydrofolate dehydrogenase/5,10-methenyltetrahydrofolate cyclohydrolase n=1 Tax=Marinivivus vitaminiproducens TaxID=3035935 RepID=UPI00279ADC55|nr:bifunctional methylenetetrahydrofolate dehydrogenase/methenyltetrahydrofolate cyclohydrolase FolD [Geminicoccaceae bacterium SCSIO 64248]
MADARLIDGKAHAAALRAALATASADFTARSGVKPTLRVVLVGEHPASIAYVGTKARMAEGAGIDAEVLRLPAETSEGELLDVIASLNADPAVHAILVQLPLPGHIDGDAVIEAIAPAKDVDGFHPINLGRLVAGHGRLPEDALVPCTPYGCLRLIRDTLGDAVAGCRAVVLGRSNIVGKPMAALLLRADCTVTVAHSRTRDLPDLCRSADILVAAVGRPGMVKASWLSPRAAVIDVGINRVATEDGKGRLVGDVDFEDVRAKVAAITPVPGGVGPMTVACLLRNTLIAAAAQSGIPAELP